MLDWLRNYILIRDFNLYYKSWEENLVNKEYRILADLLKYIKQENLILAILSGIIMQNLHKSKTIIDLAFIL